ncbi:MAG: ABC transporter permease subunit [Planctomycetaceae bacterium]|nr:ABC transporter permease subunit [Planctomycetaceae bacterium]
MDTLLTLFAQSDRLTVSGVLSRPEWIMTGVASLVILAFFFGIQYFTQLGVIARATAKEAVRQPIFILLLLFGLFFLVLITFLPFFSLGNDTKMMKDCGLMHILISCLLLGVWTASTSIASEIEGKTAMTLLSKPINRRQFIVGKLMGIINSVFMLWLPLSIFFLMLVFYKTIFESRETGESMDLRMRFLLTFQVVPGLILILFETIVMASISVAISTRLPMFVNMVICLVIFILGQLTPLLVQQSESNIEFVQFIAHWLATIIPSLDNYNVQTAIQRDSLVHPEYLAWIGLYSLLFSAIAMLFAFILFEDRDLA